MTDSKTKKPTLQKIPIERIEAAKAKALKMEPAAPTELSAKAAVAAMSDTDRHLHDLGFSTEWIAQFMIDELGLKSELSTVRSYLQQARREAAKKGGKATGPAKSRKAARNSDTPETTPEPKGAPEIDGADAIDRMPIGTAQEVVGEPDADQSKGDNSSRAPTTATEEKMSTDTVTASLEGEAEPRDSADTGPTQHSNADPRPTDREGIDTLDTREMESDGTGSEGSTDGEGATPNGGAGGSSEDTQAITERTEREAS
ncbi:hypothetical protein EU805_16870 [Salipiger sp. IMCC34102]|uniref:hypothetical protein n=1 Tax=Salipiger sp. IMCC34102 TaxID=2510647 RepID=UPI00101B70DB|nr:hypothetical protein [Salipiger sp. IMCC34102]RYH00725.1 hypothetical protein EU805_16870 [Salipiger sp. IMCC34102]